MKTLNPIFGESSHDLDKMMANYEEEINNRTPYLKPNVEELIELRDIRLKEKNIDFLGKFDDPRLKRHKDYTWSWTGIMVDKLRSLLRFNNMFFLIYNYEIIVYHANFFDNKRNNYAYNY